MKNAKRHKTDLASSPPLKFLVGIAAITTSLGRSAAPGARQGVLRVQSAGPSLMWMLAVLYRVSLRVGGPGMDVGCENQKQAMLGQQCPAVSSEPPCRVDGGHVMWP